MPWQVLRSCQCALVAYISMWLPLVATPGSDTRVMVHLAKLNIDCLTLQATRSRGTHRTNTTTSDEHSGREAKLVKRYSVVPKTDFFGLVHTHGGSELKLLSARIEFMKDGLKGNAKEYVTWNVAH